MARYPEDQMEMIQTALSQGLRGITDAARVRLQVAERENDRQFALARERESRDYNEKLWERRHKQQLDDAAVERRRALRNQLSSLMPMGQSVDPNMTEEQMSQEIAKRTRDRQIQYSNEDKQNLLDFQIKQSAALSEAETREKGRQLGIANSDGMPISELRKEVAKASTDEQIKAQQYAFNARVDAARADDKYPALRNQLASLAAERANLLAQGMLPEPVFDPSMTEEDRGQIFNVLANAPDVRSKFGDMKDGPARLAALAKGDMQAALKGLNSGKTTEIEMAITSSQKEIEGMLRSGKYGDFTAAKAAYIERLRRLPQMLGEVDRRINNLYEIGAKEGAYFGTALRFEDMPKLVQERMTGPNPSSGLPGVTGRGGLEGMLPKDPSEIPTMYDQPPIEASPNYRKGLLPSVVGLGKEMAGGLASDPVLAEGLSTLARTGDRFVDNGAMMYHNMKTFGGNLKTRLLGGQLSDDYHPYVDIFRPEEIITAPTGNHALDSAASYYRGVLDVPYGFIHAGGEGLKRLAAPLNRMSNNTVQLDGNMPPQWPSSDLFIDNPMVSTNAYRAQ